MKEAGQKPPDFFNLLSPADQLQYTELSNRLSDRSNRYKRHRRFDNFDESLTAIYSFCVRSDDGDWKRCLVCGLYWFDQPPGVCVNTRQLKQLLGNSKSSINGAFAKLGYEMMSATFTQDGNFFAIMPFLADGIEGARQWTMRRASGKPGVRSAHAARAIPPCPPPRPLMPCHYGCLCGCICGPPSDDTTLDCGCSCVQNTASGCGMDVCGCCQPVWSPHE
jgi:hypothetical protein